MKYCPRCDKHLFPKEFNKNAYRKDGLQPYCRSCQATYKVQWRKTTSSDWAEQIRRRQRRGTTQEEVDAIFESQGKKCAICQSTEPKGLNWHLDHDHLTGKNRGVLCGICNRGLGYFKDNVETLHSAVKYLKIHSIV